MTEYTTDIRPDLDTALGPDQDGWRRRSDARHGLDPEQLPGAFEGLGLRFASADDVRSWSHGEVKKKDTMDFRRNELPVDGGLFCQQIFGPVQKWSCRCGRYRGQRSQGVVCPRCKVEVGHPSARRYRMGHIELVEPVVHSWHMSGTSPILPRILSTVDRQIRKNDLASIIGFDKYIVTAVDEAVADGDTSELDVVYHIHAEDVQEELDDLMAAAADRRSQNEARIEEARRAAEHHNNADLRTEVEAEAADAATLAAAQAEADAETAEATTKSATQAAARKLRAAERAVKKEATARRKELDGRIAQRNSAVENLEKDAASSATDDEAAIGDLRHELEILAEAREAVANLTPWNELPVDDSPRALEVMYEMELVFTDFFSSETGPEAVLAMIDDLDLPSERDTLSEALTSGIDYATGRALSQSRRRDMSRRADLVTQLLGENGTGLPPSDPRNAVLHCIPVLPPDLRPVVELPGGQRGSSDLNRLYANVIDINNLLRTLKSYSSTPRVIVNEHRRRLQNAVDCLIANSKAATPTLDRSSSRALKSLAESMEGKHGLLRSSMLGKRVNYSGRSVIVVNPSLRLDQCGIPKEMALEIFKPFVANALLDEDRASTQQHARQMIDTRDAAVWTVLPDVVSDKRVLLNRAPTLHRLGIQAFEPLLVEGKAIQIHPLVCAAFNADFDGDTMAVHLPLSSKAQAEAKVLMSPSSNLLSPADGRAVTTPSQDIVIGVNWLTRIDDYDDEGSLDRYGSARDACEALGLGLIREQDPIFVDGIGVTSAGRAKLHLALPEGVPYPNRTLDKSGLGVLVEDLVSRLSPQDAAAGLDAVKDLGFEYATRSGLSIGLGDLPVPPEKGNILEKYETMSRKVARNTDRGVITVAESNFRQVDIWSEAEQAIQHEIQRLMESDPTNNISLMVGSGARGNMVQMRQIAGMKNLVQNPRGEVIPSPIKSSYADGLSALEYFMATPGARKGLADTALRTADSGYLTRRLVEVGQELTTGSGDFGDRSQSWTVDRVEPDSPGVRNRLDTRLASRCLARDVTLSDGTVLEAGRLLSDEDTTALRDDPDITSVEVLSPLTDPSGAGISRHHYGADLSTGELVSEGVAVGIIAAQSIGEPGTQLTMRTFHTGGVAGSDIAAGLPRVVDLFEARSPRPANKSFLAPASGTIEVPEAKPGDWVRTLTITPDASAADDSPVTVKIPVSRPLSVHDGDRVNIGEPLCPGAQDPNEILRLRGMADAQRYIVEEVQAVYQSQGVSLHDKHIECIVRQMTRHVEVDDPGDTDLGYGRVLLSDFTEANRKASLDQLRPATGRRVVMSITRAAMASDSWLAACSFQESIRTLFEAAMSGSVDALDSLKSAIILARPIPVGSGCEANPAHSEVDEAASGIQVSRPHRYRRLAEAREEFERQFAADNAELESTSLSDLLGGLLDDYDPAEEAEVNIADRVLGPQGEDATISDSAAAQETAS